LVAELIGDVADLLNRVETLTTTMDNAREAMNEAKWALAASVEPFQHQMAAAAEQSKAIAVKDIGSGRTNSPRSAFGGRRRRG
jgi:hypothetical protein